MIKEDCFSNVGFVCWAFLNSVRFLLTSPVQSSCVHAQAGPTSTAWPRWASAPTTGGAASTASATTPTGRSGTAGGRCGRAASRGPRPASPRTSLPSCTLRGRSTSGPSTTTLSALCLPSRAPTSFISFPPPRSGKGSSYWLWKSLPLLNACPLYYLFRF